MVPDDRDDYMLRVRMSDAERHMLDKIAGARGLTASDVVRQLIRQENERLFPIRKTKR